MAVARLTFIGVGALNAVLVTMLAARWSRRAAVAGGVLYAGWAAAVYGEQSTLLEPLGTTALLVALLLLLRRPNPPTGRADAIAGLALGLAATVKIWYVAPWAAVVLWQLAARRLRSAGRIVTAGAAALVVVLTPFLVLARGRMVDMVVRDQLLRPAAAPPAVKKWGSIFGVEPFLGHPPESVVPILVAAALLALALVRCARDTDGRVLVWVFLVDLAVLAASPSYFAHYSELTAAPMAAVVAVGAGRRVHRARRRRWVPDVVVALLVVAMLASAGVVASTPQGRTFAAARFAAAAPSGCVASDDPQILIQMDRLSHDLATGCRVEVDVTGTTYDRLNRRRADGTPVPRQDNLAFQRFLRGYLLSADSFVVARRKGDAMPPRLFRELARQPELARSGRLVLRAGLGALGR
ncbi:MAG TPA: hypothetical protein VFT62_06285, partial [Mycobacteriales bacterium]|nr:hypothetical protein [Mycobacteriales bacterium]